MELSIIPVWSLVQRAATEFRLAAAAKNIRYKVGCSQVAKVDDQDPNEKQFSDASKEAPISPANDSESPVVMHTPVDPRQQYVVGDPVRICQILRSFISNALENLDSGEISVQASWKHFSENKCATEKPEKFILDKGERHRFSKCGFVQIDVRDSGGGMSEEEVKNIFGEGTQQFDIDRLQSGVGSALGLFMCNGIAEQLGGYVEVSSAGTDCGTCFTLVLPLRHVPESSLPERCRIQNQPESGRTETSSETEPESQQHFRILIVDDAKVCRKLLTRLLKSKGHICEEAENGLRAVEMVKKAMKKAHTTVPYCLTMKCP